MPSEESIDHDRERLHIDLERLYRGAYRTVFAAVYLATGDTQVAEDMTQQAFLELAEGRIAWYDRPWPEQVSLARTIALRRSLDHSRRSRRLVEVVRRAGGWTASGAFTHVESDVFARDVVRLIHKLPPGRTRVIAILAYLNDRAAVQIAEELGIDASTVRTVLQRVRSQFRSALVEPKPDSNGRTRPGYRHNRRPASQLGGEGEGA